MWDKTRTGKSSKIHSPSTAGSLKSSKYQSKESKHVIKKYGGKDKHLKGSALNL